MSERASAPGRVEDGRLLTGGGRFVDDLDHSAAEVAFVRSEHAHARVLDIDTSGVRERDGVLAVYTWKDLEGRFGDPLPLIAPHPGILAARTQTALAREEVCYVGEAVAMVVAVNRYIAEDAADGIGVSYEPLRAIVDLEDALKPGAVSAHADLDGNLAALASEESGDVDAAMAAAPHVFEWQFVIDRSAAMPLEGRAVLAHHDTREDVLLVRDSTQVPTSVRRALASVFEGIVGRVDVVAPDVGGGFGMKGMHLYPEELLVPWAAQKLGLAVKWTEDRREEFIGSNHERRQVHNVRVGCEEDGEIVAFESRFLHDTGAYCPYGLVVPLNTATHLPGPYRIPNYRYELRSVFTNTVPTSPYRGAGRTQAAFVMEATVDRVSAALGLDRAEVRRRNFIGPDQFPYPRAITVQGGGTLVYDSGDYGPALDLLLREIGYAQFSRERERAAASGRRLGLGIACSVEGGGVGPYEGAVVEVLPSGEITVATGVSTQGQSHETVLAQVAARELGVHVESVRVTTGDTRRMPHGVGTFASRTAVVAGSAVQGAAARVAQRARELAAAVLEARADDLELVDGDVRVIGSPSARLALADLAVIAEPVSHSFGPRAERLAKRATSLPLAERLDPSGAPGLRAVEYFAPASATWGSGAHGAIVEIDEVTCEVRVRRYVIVHDSGRVLNHQVVEGQLHGGLAQGLAGALYESIAYTDEGQLSNASFMDFLMPYATELPHAELHSLETPAPGNPLGVKGAGESGTITAPAAIASALSDALGVPIARLPVSPELIRALLDGPAADLEPTYSGTSP